MKRANIIFGGLGYSKKVLRKFSNIYENGDNIIIPFTFSSMILGKNYNDYNILNKKLNNYKDVHIHVLSGSCHYLYNFLEKYPQNKEKVKTQIYDSPCHIKGITPSLKEIYGISPFITENLIDILFKDCVKTSEAFNNNILIPDIPTGIIKSTNDIIAPPNAIDNLINLWEKDCEYLNVLETDSKHLQSLKDNKEEYINFCNKVYFSN
jgi:hypothetical protein